MMDIGHGDLATVRDVQLVIVAWTHARGMYLNSILLFKREYAFV